jgi:hypothetical protein
MSDRKSLIGGSIAFTAVIILSILSLDVGKGGGSFMLELVPLEVEVPSPGEDTTESPSKRDCRS